MTKKSAKSEGVIAVPFRLVLPMRDHTGGVLSDAVLAALKNGAKSHNIKGDEDHFELSDVASDDIAAIRACLNDNEPVAEEPVVEEQPEDEAE